MASVSTHLAGKTAVITGATQGIGLEAAKALAAQGARIIITARDASRGEKAKADIKAAGKVDVDVVAVDFASMASIREGAAAVRALTPSIDILLNNAGAVYSERVITPDGLELTFAVNHIGYFLWTHELLEHVKKGTASRIVNVASTAHMSARSGVSWHDLDRKDGKIGMLVYGETKLMNILFTRELARRLSGSGVTANCLHPGVIASGFATNTSGILGWGARNLGKFFLQSTEQGARTSVYLCASPEVAGVTGKYFSSCKEATPSRAARDDAAAARLWTLSEEICGIAEKKP